MRDGPAPSGSASVIVQPLRVPNGVVLTIPRYVVRYIASEGGEPALYDEAIGAYAQFDVGEYVIRAQDHDRLVADLHAALAKSEQEKLALEQQRDATVAVCDRFRRGELLGQYGRMQADRIVELERQRDALQGTLETLQAKLLEPAP